MSKYTQTVYSILRENLLPGEDITSLSDICACAKRCLFDYAPMNVISSDYRDRLITGFCLHYRWDEYGVDTLTDFKMGIAEKIINNAEYINGIFDMLDNQVLSEYKTVSANGTTHDTIVDDKSIRNTGTVTNGKTGNDKALHLGNERTDNGGYDSDIKSGYEENTKNGTERHNYGNVHDAYTEKGTDTNYNNLHYKDITDEHSKNDRNAAQYGLDTPENNVDNLRSAAGGGAYNYDIEGNAGINASSRSSMKYMSSASLSDDTARDVGHSETEHIDMTGSNTSTQYGKGSDTYKNGYEENQFINRADRHTYNNLTDRKEYHSYNTRTPQLEDRTEYNSTETRTDNTTETGHGNTVKNGTNGRDETSRDVNMEMIYRSLPLLNRLWEVVFDELFMSIY